MTAQAPTPFPYEGPAYELPIHRPPVRRPIDDDYDWDHHWDRPDPGTPAARAVITIWFACWLAALMAAVVRQPWSGPAAITAFGVALITAGLGWAAARTADKKAGQ